MVEKGIVDDYKFVHPKDIQDGIIEVNPNDVLANIPYVPGCGLWFDHHVSEEKRLEATEIKFKGDSRPAPSAAQVIWDYYGGKDTFSDQLKPLLHAVNKSDAGNLSHDEILEPAGWFLISFIMDPRTGLGRFRDYRISNYQLMLELIQHCRTKTAEEILAISDVQERSQRYQDHREPFKNMLKRCCKFHDNVIVTNLLGEETIYCGNRFVVYALNQEQNIEIRMMWGRNKQNVVFTCGHSILNRTSGTHVGRLMLEYNGGGHEMVGTCQVDVDDYKKVLSELIERMQDDG